MTMRGGRLFLAAAAATVLAAAGVLRCAAAEPDGRTEFRPDDGPAIDSVVASVNGEPISLSDILPLSRSREFQLYAVHSGDALFAAVKAERKRVLEELIDRKLLVAAYRSDPFPIPPQYLESYLDDLADSMGVRSRREFAEMLRAAGQSLEEMRREAGERLIVQAMTSRRNQIAVNVTPKEVYEYFERNLSEFSRPERWRLWMIFIGREEPDRALALAETVGALAVDPARFEELAKKRAGTAAAGEGGTPGDLGLIESGRIRPEFAAALTAAPAPGKVYGPVTTPEGDYFLRVTEIVAAETVDFRAAAPEIRARLEAGEREKSLRQYLDDLRTKAIVRYYL